MRFIFDRLNLKRQSAILVVVAPPLFDGELEAFDGVAVWRDVEQVEAIQFGLLFSVRRVAIDADWSALRFRRSAFIGC